MTQKNGPFVLRMAVRYRKSQTRSNCDLPASLSCRSVGSFYRPSDDRFFPSVVVDSTVFHVPQSVWSSSQNEYLYHR